MAEQVTPLTGSPLSQESRQVIARSTSVSGQDIRGANLLSPVAPSESEIRNLQVAQKNQESLVEIKGGLFGVQQDINRLNGGLINIANLLQQDAVNEERLLRSQQERERRLAEEQVRIGRESDVERKIEAAIVAPVQRVAPKVQNLFGNVLQSLGFLFGGWLTNQVIEYIKAEGKGNNERLEEIKKNIIKGLGVAGGTLLAAKLGIELLKRTLFGITKQLGSLIGKAVFAPINAIKNILPGGGGGGAKPPSGTKPGSGGTPKPTGGILSGLKNFGGGLKNTAGNFVKGMGLPLLTGSIMTGLDIKSGEDPGRAVAGTVGGMVTSGAAFAAGSLLPIPGSGVISGALAYSPGQDIGKGIYDKFFGAPQTTPPPPTTTTTTENPKVTPTETLTGQKLETPSPQTNTEASTPQKPLDIDNNSTSMQNQIVSEMKSIMPSETLIGQATEEPKANTYNLEQKLNFPNYSNIFNLPSTEKSPEFVNSDSTENQLPLLDVKNIFADQKSPEQSSDLYSGLIPPKQTAEVQSNTINSLPKQGLNVGELPEPKPNIVYATTGSQSNPSVSSSSGPVGTSGVLADVPIIAPNNPDNFHVLLAYSIYNVTL